MNDIIQNLLRPDTLADAVGIVAFAIAGILAGRGKGIDPVGVFVLAFTTAFGGGLLRDIIIDQRPFYWVAHTEYVWLTMILTFFAPRIVRRFEEKTANEILVVADAVGLGFFTASGTAAALANGLPPLPAVLMGVCTGVFGGLTRDVFLAQIPAVISDRKPYAIVSFAGAWLQVLMLHTGTHTGAALWIAAIVITFARLWTYEFRLEIRYNSALAQKIFPEKAAREESRPEETAPLDAEKLPKEKGKAARLRRLGSKFFRKHPLPITCKRRTH